MREEEKIMKIARLHIEPPEEDLQEFGYFKIIFIIAVIVISIYKIYS